MHRSTFKAMTTSALVGALAMSAIVPAAVAAEGDLTLEEIVVTARKRKEDIQTVPIVIQAYSAEDLQERGIKSLADLANNTPGLTFSNTAGGAATNIVIRGLAPGSSATLNDTNVESNVGVFIDGIYQTSRNTADILQMIEVGQVDVVKGPQSALYGRSTFAGAIGITSAAPSDKPEGRASVTVGSDGDYRGQVSLSQPLIEDKLYGRISAAYSQFDGTNENDADPSDNLGGYEKRGVSLALRFTPTERLTANLTAFATKSNMEMVPLNTVSPSQHNCGAYNAVSQAYMLYCGEVKGSDSSDVSTGMPDSVAKNQQAALELNYEFDNFTIVSVSGATHSSITAYNDYDGTSTGSLFGVCTVGTTCGTSSGTYTRTVNSNAVLANSETIRTVSQELRIQSPDGDRFQWLAGAFFFESDVDTKALNGTDRAGLASNERLVMIQPGAAAGTGAMATLANLQLVSDSNAYLTTSGISGSQNVTKSLFGSLGYEVIDGLKVSAEGRYNIDRKTSTCILSYWGAYGPCPGAQPASAEFKSFTPRFSADYQVNDDMFLFASAAKGVRAGGFNAVAGILDSERTFDEEENWTYEIGTKSWLFDRRVMFNASLFYVDWTNLQVSTFSQSAAVAQNIVTNVGKMTSKGFELQGEFKATDILSVGGSLTYSDPEFGDDAYDPSTATQCGTSSTCELVLVSGRGYYPTVAGNAPARAVKWQYNLHATANVPVDDEWVLSGRVDVNYTGKAYTSILNTTYFGERTLANLRIALANDQYTLAAWVTNLTDEKYVTNILAQPRLYATSAQRIMEAYAGERRRFGLTGSVKF